MDVSASGNVLYWQGRQENVDAHPQTAPFLSAGSPFACGPKTDTGESQDADNDGFSEPVDFDDANALVNPNAIEICNTIDDDCDGLADPDDAEGATEWYADLDGDTFGDPDTSTTTCWAPKGFVDDSGDCNDESEALAIGCEGPEGIISLSGDCDDDNPDFCPGALETCGFLDLNCDGFLCTDRTISGLASSENLPTTTGDLDGDRQAEVAIGLSGDNEVLIMSGPFDDGVSLPGGISATLTGGSGLPLHEPPRGSFLC